MGFFDSVIPGDKSGASAATQQASTAVVTAPAPATQSSGDADFLIIDDSMSVANVPDTVSESSDIVMMDAPSDAIVVSEQSEGLSSAEAVLISDAVQMDVPATETAAVETPAAGLTFESATPVTEETPVARTDSSSLLDFSSMTALSVAPAIEEAPVLVSDAVQMDVPATETAAVETPATEVSNSSFGFDSFASAPETPAIEVQASVAVETARQVTDSLDPEAILLSSISQLESVVESKESARDAEMARTENLNAQIAELKKQAKESQERAREIDAGADRARSLIANLKTQIQAAA